MEVAQLLALQLVHVATGHAVLGLTRVDDFEESKFQVVISGKYLEQNTFVIDVVRTNSIRWHSTRCRASSLITGV